jgi:hypothetical protein
MVAEKASRDTIAQMRIVSPVVLPCEVIGGYGERNAPLALRSSLRSVRAGAFISSGRSCTPKACGNDASGAEWRPERTTRVEKHSLPAVRSPQAAGKLSAKANPPRRHCAGFDDVSVRSQMSPSVTRREKYASRPSRVTCDGPMMSRWTEKTFSTLRDRASTT